MGSRKKRDGNAPFAIMLDLEFLDRLSEPVRVGKAPSVSAVIRTALARFDFSQVLVMHPAQLQISVRLPARIRQLLKKTARSKHTTIGQLVRAAVEAYLPQLEAEAAGQLEIPIEPEPEVPAAVPVPEAVAESLPAAPVAERPAPKPKRPTGKRPKKKAHAKSKPAAKKKKPAAAPARRRKGMTKKGKG